MSRPIKPYLCKHCGETNPAMFPSRYKSVCKACRKQYNNDRGYAYKYYHSHKEAYCQRAKKYRSAPGYGKRRYIKYKEKNKLYGKLHPEIIAANNRKYRDKLALKWGHYNLSDIYIKSTLTIRTGLSAKDLPAELVELQRLRITLKRMLKNGNNKNNQ